MADLSSDTTLQRRRELARLSKPELIDVVIGIEVDISAVAHTINAVLGDDK